MVIDMANLRRDAAQRARRKGKGIRINSFSPGCPTDWRPTTVVDPTTGRPFQSDDQAWNFVADCLEAGEEIEQITLDSPFGNNDQAYVMIVSRGNRRIYIKFQLGSRQIIGRSFHYS